MWKTATCCSPATVGCTIQRLVAVEGRIHSHKVVTSATSWRPAFAHGLGREIVWCCWKAGVGKLHFDTRYLGHMTRKGIQRVSGRSSKQASAQTQLTRRSGSRRGDDANVRLIAQLVSPCAAARSRCRACCGHPAATPCAFRQQLLKRRAHRALMKYSLAAVGLKLRVVGANVGIGGFCRPLAFHL